MTWSKLFLPVLQFPAQVVAEHEVTALERGKIAHVPVAIGCGDEEPTGRKDHRHFVALMRHGRGSDFLQHDERRAARFADRRNGKYRDIALQKHVRCRRRIRHGFCELTALCRQRECALSEPSLFAGYLYIPEYIRPECPAKMQGYEEKR